VHALGDQIGILYYVYVVLYTVLCFTVHVWFCCVRFSLFSILTSDWLEKNVYEMRCFFVESGVARQLISQ